MEKQNAKFDCLVGSFILKDDFPNSWYIDKIKDKCTIFFSPGAKYGDFVRYVHPMFLEMSPYSTIVLLLDDVQLGTFDLEKAIEISINQKLDVFSPMIQGGT